MINTNINYYDISDAILEKISAVKADKSDFMQYNHRTIRILDRRHIVAQLFPLSFHTTTSYNDVHLHHTVLTLFRKISELI